MSAGIILEGVTGAGKSQTLRALQAHPDFATLLGAGRVFAEEETFGEFMSELQDPALRPDQRYARLGHVLAELLRTDAAASRRGGYVLERFHPSYYALVPDWSLYDAIDRQMQRLGAIVILLTVPPARLEQRALDRVERAGEGWTAGMIAHFGSRAAANAAIAQSQITRRAGLRLSRLATTEIDTSAMDWPRYAEAIVRAWRAAPAASRAG